MALVGEYIRKYREGAGMTVAEAAAKSGIAAAVWEAVEANTCGAGQGSGCLLCDIAATLGCKVADLIQE